MKDDIFLMFVIFTFVVVISTVSYNLGHYFGARTQRRAIYQEAIEAGVGEYYINQYLENEFRFFCSRCPSHEV